jgi:hypothetical protein
MFIGLSILILVALTRILRITHAVRTCAGIYAGVGLIFGMLASTPLSGLVLGTAIDFGGSWLFFSLLERYVDDFKMYWLTVVVFVVGPPLIMIYVF